jgi:uncharacterized damage-inducible protein DinB
MNTGPEAMLSEFREEAATTKRILDRVPADKLSWRPHAKSMSLGQLALHIAAIPGSIAKLAQLMSLTLLRLTSSRRPPKIYWKFIRLSTRVFAQPKSA